MADPKYAALFLAESREHLRACNQLLLAWERDATASEPVNGLFRAVHNIKGMAATLGYSAVADLAHRAESLLETVRGGRAATPDLIQLLFRSVDALEKAIEGAAAGKDEKKNERCTRDSHDASSDTERRSSLDERRLFQDLAVLRDALQAAGCALAVAMAVRVED